MDTSTFDRLSPAIAHKRPLLQGKHSRIGLINTPTNFPHPTTIIQQHLADNDSSAFMQFYVTCKLHKPQKEPTDPYPTHPVCSDVTSYPHALGKWIVA